jgi:hypothetical protein
LLVFKNREPGLTPFLAWRSFDYDELMKRDTMNVAIFWLKDKSLE